MSSGEVCVNYNDGSQLKLDPSGSSTVTYTDTHGQESRYASELDTQDLLALTCFVPLLFSEFISHLPCPRRYGKTGTIPESVKTKLLQVPQIINKFVSQET